MDLCRPLQVRREGFQKVPFLGFHPNRIGRSVEGRDPKCFGRANQTDGDKIGPSLRPDVFIVMSRGFE
jgi:hypothetical protein